MTRILLVMPYRQLVRKAKEEGFWVCSVWDPSLESPEYLADVEELSDAFLLTDFTDQAGLKRVVGEAVERHAITLVHHLGREDSMLSTYEVAESLGRALNPSRSIRLLNDKLAMRRSLQERGLSPIRFGHAPTKDRVRRLLGTFGLPAIVKPTSLAGSRGVYLVESEEDVARWEHLLRAYDYDGPFIVEERLSGPEFSVETLSFDASHHVVGITRKQVTPPPLFVELGHLHPAPLADDHRRQIEALVVGLLDLCEYRFGPAHTEVIWTPGGPRIVESQARLGGDRIPRLIELTTGTDVERSIFQMMDGRAPTSAPHRGFAQIVYFQFPTGFVEAVDGLEDALRVQGVDEVVVKAKVGEHLVATTDSKTRHGYVIVSGRSEEEVTQRLRRVRQVVTVTTRCPALPEDDHGVPAAGRRLALERAESWV